MLCIHCSQGMVETELHFLNESCHSKIYGENSFLNSKWSTETLKNFILKMLLGEDINSAKIAARYVETCHRERESFHQLNTWGDKDTQTRAREREREHAVHASDSQHAQQEATGVQPPLNDRRSFTTQEVSFLSNVVVTSVSFESNSCSVVNIFHV